MGTNRKEYLENKKITSQKDIQEIKIMRRYPDRYISSVYPEIILEEMNEIPEGTFRVSVPHNNKEGGKTNFSCYMHKGTTEYLYVFISAAHKTEVGFNRWTYKNLIPDSILCVDDPIHLGEDELEKADNGWFFGTEAINYQILATKIVSKIIEQIGIPLDNVIIFGSSSAASVALHMSSYMKRDDIHPFPIAINPQILPEKNKWTKPLYEQNESWNDRFDERADTLYHIGRLNMGLIIVNGTDSTDMGQILGNISNELQYGIQKIDKIHIWLYDAPAVPYLNNAHRSYDTHATFMLIDYVAKELKKGIEIDRGLSIIFSEIWNEIWQIRLQGNLDTIDKLLNRKLNRETLAYKMSSKSYGNPDGLMRLSRCYSEGIGVEKNTIIAQDYMKKAADSGLTEAKIEYFDLLYKEKTKEGYKKALQYAIKEFDPNNAMMKGRLARAYRDGRGVKKDPKKARLLMRECVNTSDHPTWCEWELFDMLYSTHTPEDIDEMNKLMENGISKGEKEFEGRYGRMYRDGIGVKKDLQRAAIWMRKSVAKKLVWTRIEIFDVLWDIGSEDSYQEAYETIRPLADLGYKRAMGRVARAYRDGKGVQKDLDEAEKWMRKAAEKKLVWAPAELEEIISMKSIEETTN